MNSDSVGVDELILLLADLQKRLCRRGGRKAVTQVLTFLGSVTVYGKPYAQRLASRQRARQQLRQIIDRIRVRMLQQRERGYRCSTILK